jgi:hypothetical protein
MVINVLNPSSRAVPWDLLSLKQKGVPEITDVSGEYSAAGA